LRCVIDTYTVYVAFYHNNFLDSRTV